MNGVVVPLLLRACDSPNPKAQEEVLKNLGSVSGEGRRLPLGLLLRAQPWSR